MASLTPTPAITYTPNGIQRQPGYYNPYNPYDTGRNGEQNSELNGGRNATLSGWNYDLGQPYSGTALDPNTGLYNSETGGGGGGSFGPGFDQMMADLKAQTVSDKASRDSAIRRSFINFGLDNFDLSKAAKTTGIGDLGSVLDSQTLQLAANNKFSVQNRLEQALAQQKQANRVALRQRGGVRSGEAGYSAQQTQRAFDTDEYDATQKLLDYISGAQAGFAQAERERQMQMWQLALAAAQRGGYGGYSGGGGVDPPPAAPAAPPVPGFSLPSGGSPLIKTGGGYYTNPQDDFTAKWLRLAGIS